MLFEFGPFELDLATCELRREGESVGLQPRVFGLLRYLIEHRDRVIGKQELIDALWNGYQLNAVAVPWTINRARKALGDQSNESRYIETMRGHGYRFVAELRTVTDDAVAHGAVAPSTVGPGTRRTGFADRPFVGRAAIMARLTAALEAAVEGNGTLCLLSGKPASARHVARTSSRCWRGVAVYRCGSAAASSTA